MKISKILSASMAFASLVLLTGCPASDAVDAVSSFPIKPWRNCVQIEHHFRQIRDCAYGISFEGDLDADFNLNIDELQVDLSEGTVDVLSSDGWFHLNLKLLDSTTASTSVQWVNVSDKLFVSDPIGLTQWLAQFEGLMDQVEVTFPQIRVASEAGANTFVAELKYQEVLLEGTTFSWYDDNSSGCEGILPNHQLCE